MEFNDQQLLKAEGNISILKESLRSGGGGSASGTSVESKGF
jgi:hypothetical protein